MKMKNDELVIKEITLARYGGVVDSASIVEGNQYKHIQISDFTVEKTITGVVDYFHEVIIDIETGKVFPILNRDENRRIIDELNIGELYPLYMQNKNWDEISYLYQLVIKSQAKRVYQRYLENRELEENNKTKTKNIKGN